MTLQRFDRITQRGPGRYPATSRPRQSRNLLLSFWKQYITTNHWEAAKQEIQR